MLSLVRTALAKSPRAGYIKPVPVERLTGLGMVLKEVKRLLKEACAAGLLRGCLKTVRFGRVAWSWS